jgi:GNAT superfamily N-acetyltransferase
LLKDYLNREAYLTTVPLAKDGGITQWILTVAGLPPDQRPILSSCESLRKHAVVCSGPSGSVVDGTAHGIASVFTDPQFRGRGYASRMMRELGERLRTWQVSEDSSAAGSETARTGSPKPIPGHSHFSVLYSDIGKSFYAKNGWAPFASSHLAFAPAPSDQENSRVSLIGYHELAELCAVDERLLRGTLAQRAGETGKTCVALLPSLDAMLWHMMREDFMTKHIFGRTPAVKGAVFGEPGKRVWAVWSRGYYGGLETLEGNTFYILRFVIEDESSPEEYLVEGFRSIMQVAQAQAAEWRSQVVQMWNPTPKLQELVKISAVQHEEIHRDSESIASLMWYGDGATSDLDWVLNEKYGWC